MLQCDLAGMFSPRLFNRFVLPDLQACCAALEHAFFHLDGPGAIPHLPALLDLPGLTGVQWVPTDRRPGADAWLPLLEKIVSSGKLCQIYVSAEEALNVVRHLGGRNFALYVVTRMPAAQADAFLRQIALADLSLIRA